MKIILFSPNKYSEYSLAVYELLIKHNIKVDYVFCLGFTFKRFYIDFKKYPFETLKKIIKRVFFKKYFYKTNNKIEGILDLRKKININLKSLDSKNNKLSNVEFVNDFNEVTAIHLVKKIKPDLIIFTGGGIMKKEILSIPKIGILNCHMGILPNYRGMHVAEWCIYYDDYDNLGCTSHLMEINVDTGKVIDIRNIKLKNVSTLDEVYSIFEKNMTISLINAVLKLKEDHNFHIFRAKKSKLFFRMDNKKISVVKKKLKTLN